MAAVVGNTAKIRALRESRTLNPRPEAVTDEAFVASSFLDPHDLVQVKYEMVRRVRVDKVPVARAAKAFGFCRQSFYAIAAALDAEGPAGLVPGKPGPKGPSKLTGPVMEHLEALLAADPGMKARDLAAAVAEEFGLTVHPRSVERALARRREGRGQEGDIRAGGRPTFQDLGLAVDQDRLIAVGRRDTDDRWTLGGTSPS